MTLAESNNLQDRCVSIYMQPHSYMRWESRFLPSCSAHLHVHSHALQPALFSTRVTALEQLLESTRATFLNSTEILHKQISQSQAEVRKTYLGGGCVYIWTRSCVFDRVYVFGCNTRCQVHQYFFHLTMIWCWEYQSPPQVDLSCKPNLHMATDPTSSPYASVSVRALRHVQ